MASTTGYPVPGAEFPDLPHFTFSDEQHVKLLLLAPATRLKDIRIDNAILGGKVVYLENARINVSEGVSIVILLEQGGFKRFDLEWKNVQDYTIGGHEPRLPMERFCVRQLEIKLTKS